VPGHDMIVIGASAGGVEALTALVGGLPAHLPASVFIALHIPPSRRSRFPTILNRSGRLIAFHPVDNAVIEYGCISVAPPDHHMVIEDGRVRIVSGPTEHRERPAIDPLFRSAAQIYGPRVVGVVLTGMRTDGTAGLLAVKQRGGVAIVQDPDEARYPDMPRSALAHVAVDYTLPLSRIAPLLIRLIDEPVKAQ
jgi:two-component system, chemotaxis family, protein-glutamate methylesterase/glutaminase